MKRFFIILFHYSTTFLSAQNLVLNPSFEKHNDSRCMVFMGSFNRSIKQWSTPNKGTTDFFDTCSKDLGAENYNGFQEPKTGTSYAGMYLYTDKNYREYVQGEFIKTLEKGKKYTMTFYLSLADKSSYALKEIQVLMTEEKLEACYHSNRCEKVIKPSKATKGKFKIYSNAEEHYFSNKEVWVLYSFEFIAEGYESYFTIGNFFKNSKTEKQKILSESPFFFSYYYIDEVSVQLFEKRVTVESDVTLPKTEMKSNQIYAFKNVLFDIDKAELLKPSITELDNLFEYLSKKSDLKIEIYGHTDNSGIEKRNRELSHQRAKAVADYLILQGLDKSKIQTFGFGSTKPISDNTTEKGRAENRRVEFKLIE